MFIIFFGFSFFIFYGLIRHPLPATHHPLPVTRLPSTRHPPPATRGKVLSKVLRKPSYSKMSATYLLFVTIASRGDDELNVTIALFVVTRGMWLGNVTITRTGVVNRETADDYSGGTRNSSKCKGREVL